MKLRLGVLDVLLVIALVIAGIVIHNKYSPHPTPAEQKWLSTFVYRNQPKSGRECRWRGEGSGMDLFLSAASQVKKFT